MPSSPIPILNEPSEILLIVYHNSPVLATVRRRFQGAACRRRMTVPESAGFPRQKAAIPERLAAVCIVISFSVPVKAGMLFSSVFAGERFRIGGLLHKG